jgi:hypothetical protein
MLPLSIKFYLFLYKFKTFVKTFKPESFTIMKDDACKPKGDETTTARPPMIDDIVTQLLSIFNNLFNSFLQLFRF